MGFALKGGCRLVRRPVILCAALLLLGGCSDSPREAHAPRIVAPANHQELLQLFTAHDYRWDTVEKGVPPLIFMQLPADLDRIAEVAERKEAFFLALLPMVLLLNEEILRQREAFQETCARHDRGVVLPARLQEAVLDLAREYKVEGDPLREPEARSRLLKRLDMVPVSMVLAQAAVESGYGTSRFARLGNNLFGEWTFVPGTGLVPLGRPAGATYEVRRFASPYDSVRSYMRNINTHWAYRELRERRALLRAEGLPLRGLDLAGGLLNYSERREAYVQEIRSVIRGNGLSRLAAATLRPLPPGLPQAKIAATEAPPLLANTRPAR